MFRQLARWFQEQETGRLLQNGDSSALTRAQGQAAFQILQLHPAQLSRFLEEMWRARRPRNDREWPARAYPDSFLGAEMNSRIADILRFVGDDIYPLPGTGKSGTATWDHLIYAYMVENTRIFEIFTRLMFELLHGERLEIPDATTQRWIRATEELFFRDPPPYAIDAITSRLRPDPQAVRRNAYYRMFGLDLNHGTADNRPYPYEKPAMANRQFVQTFEDFAREVWRGIENSYNTAGANTTDDAAIANLARTLADMLTARRGQGSGNLSREEFEAVAMMSWFHLTVDFDESPIVRHLRAEGPSPAERLRKIGERVGLPAHSRAHSYFELSSSMSRLLLAVERGEFNGPGQAQLLYRLPTDGVNPIRDDMQTVITHWSIATGRDLKASKVTVTPRRPEDTALGRNGNAARPRLVTREFRPSEPAMPH